MAGRSRTRRVLKYSGLALCLSLAVAWAASLLWFISYRNGYRWSALFDGRVMVIPTVIDDGWGLGPSEEYKFTHQMYGWGWPDWVSEPEPYIFFPIWIPLAAAALPTALLWCRDRWAPSAAGPAIGSPARTPRILKWVGSVGCLLLAATLATSGRWRVKCSGDRLAIVISGGCITFDVRSTWDSFWSPRSREVVFEQYGRQVKWWCFPRRCTETVKQFGFPLWLPLLVLAIPTSFFWRLDWRRRFAPGHCQHCGYDLTGNVSGRCPECGTAISREGKTA